MKVDKFTEILEAAIILHNKKAADYGSNTDIYANIRQSRNWGIRPWIGAMNRLSDKIIRLQQLATKGSLSNESALDSFDDIIVYAVIAKIMFEEENAPVTQLVE